MDIAPADALQRIDYVALGAYLALSVLVGLWFARRGTRSMSAYFVGDRGMPWWLAGVSILATAFAADTPLWIGDMIYRRGIQGAWLHWAPGIGAAFFVFIIAPLWRRCGVMTDLEFLEARYSGREAALVRGFSGLYYAFFWNIMMMAVGILSIATILHSTMDMPKLYAVLLTAGAAMIYSTASGIWGVCAADFMQFFVYLFGSTVLAFYAVKAAGGSAALLEQVSAMKDWAGHDLSVLPRPQRPMGLPLMTVLFIFSFRWMEHTQFGYFVSQRLFSTRTVKHALWAALLWVVLYWSVIPLPWIVTIIASKVVLPGLTVGQEAYPRMALAVLPAGLKGLLLAALMAAFMSTYSSLLNWGSSYVVNDLYRRFAVRHGSTRHYVVVSQVVMIVMGAAAALIALYSESVLHLLFYVLMAGTGTYTVHLARWLWWRVNAWSEIAALGGSIACTLAVCSLRPLWVAGDGLEQYYGHRMFVVVLGTLVFWLAVTFLTRPVRTDTLDSFFRRVRPPGFWGPARRRTGCRSEMNWPGMVRAWLLMLVAIYAPLVGLIKLAFRQWPLGVSLTAVGAVAIVLAVRKAMAYTEPTDTAETSAKPPAATSTAAPGKNATPD